MTTVFTEMQYLETVQYAMIMHTLGDDEWCKNFQNAARILHFISILVVDHLESINETI